MIIYVSHAYGGKKENYEKAKRITHDLQIENPTHCFICPLISFGHLEYGEIGYDEELELCIDILSVADVLIVASEPSKGVQKEIDFARMVGMEVIFLENQCREI